MDTKADTGVNKFVHRHLSQIKVLSRLMEHELDAANGREVTIDRDVIESMLDTLEIFVEDLQGSSGVARESRVKVPADKPAVTRLN